MKSLAELQTGFQSSIVNGGGRFATEIEETVRIGAEQRIAIYGDAYRLRLLEALEENYLGLSYLLGDGQFEVLGRNYIDTHPSGFDSIRWFGDRLPDYLAQQGAYSKTPVLKEMAQADWTMTLAFDARNAESASIEDMASFAPEQWATLKFEFHPSMFRLDLEWNVLPFRSKVEFKDADTQAPEQSEYPVCWIIWRKDLRILYRSMEVDEAWALDAALSGEDFSYICGGLTEWMDESNAPERAAGFLKRWLVDELITRIGV